MKVIKSSRYCRQLFGPAYTLSVERKKIGRSTQGRERKRGERRRGTPSELSPGADVVDGQGWFAPPAEAARKAQGADWKRVARVKTGQDGRATRRGQRRVE